MRVGVRGGRGSVSPLWLRAPECSRRGLVHGCGSCVLPPWLPDQDCPPLYKLPFRPHTFVVPPLGTQRKKNEPGPEPRRERAGVCGRSGLADARPLRAPVRLWCPRMCDAGWSTGGTPGLATVVAPRGEWREGLRVRQPKCYRFFTY